MGRKTYLICFQSGCVGLCNCYFRKSQGDVEYDRISVWVTSTGTVEFCNWKMALSIQHECRNIEYFEEIEWQGRWWFSKCIPRIVELCWRYAAGTGLGIALKICDGSVPFNMLKSNSSSDSRCYETFIFKFVDHIVPYAKQSTFDRYSSIEMRVIR